MDLLSALNVLRNATDEDLRPYQTEAYLMLKNVEQQLRAIADAEATTSFRHYKQAILSTASGGEYCSRNNPEQSASRNDSVANNAPNETTRSCNLDQTRTESSSQAVSPSEDIRAFKAVGRVDILYKALIKALPWVWQFIRRKPPTIIQKKRVRNSDRRFEDIRRVDGNKTTTEYDKILKGAAQRSLGLRFTNAEKKRTGQTKVDRLYHAICDGTYASEKRRGNVAEFVRELCFDDEDPKAVARGVNAGIRQLVFEKFIQEQLKTRTGSSALKSTGGISLATSLTIKAFRELYLEQIPLFVDMLFRESSTIELPLHSSGGVPQITPFM